LSRNSLENSKAKLGNGIEVTIVPSRSKLKGMRDYSLKKAADLIKADGRSNGKAAKIIWKDRIVELDGNVVFKQPQFDTGGSFLGLFAHLGLQ
jgi:hypothetical protein